MLPAVSRAGVDAKRAILRAMAIEIRRLRPGDEAVVERLATREPHVELLADERTFFLVAFDGDAPVGFVLAHELPRRHAPRAKLFVYELGVEETHRRRGIATRLLQELRRLGRAGGIETAFVLTNASNAPAMALYESAGGVRPSGDDVLWELR